MFTKNDIKLYLRRNFSAWKFGWYNEEIENKTWVLRCRKRWISRTLRKKKTNLQLYSLPRYIFGIFAIRIFLVHLSPINYRCIYINFRIQTCWKTFWNCVHMMQLPEHSIHMLIQGRNGLTKGNVTEKLKTGKNWLSG